MKIIILLGGNIGDTAGLFRSAADAFIARGYELEKTSSLYRSEAWGYESANPYLNQVIILNREIEAEEVLNDALEIEKELGRVRIEDGEYHDRPIDVDILYLDDKVLKTERLEVPHPRLHLRNFTLLPLEEILPDFIHPLLKKDHKSLVLLCPDQNSVERIA